MTIHPLNIFLSSPGDVSRERELARKVIEELGRERGHRDRLKLDIVAWDLPGAGTAMSAHLEPQDAINKGLSKPSECDIVIVIFGARMGTLLSEKYRKPNKSRYRSGTEYEFLEALNAAKESGKPQVLVYRRKKPPKVRLNDPNHDEIKKQWDLVEEFFAEFRNPDGSYQGYYYEYKEPAEFQRLLERGLRDFIARYLKEHPLVQKNVPMLSKAPIWDRSKPPFPGLRAFTPDEAPIFCGRDDEIEELKKKMRDRSRSFIAIVGASGSGKSSLVAAGLVPALKNNIIYGIHSTEDWVWVQFTPGDVGNNPIAAFAVGFKNIIEKKGYRLRFVAKDLETDPKEVKKICEWALEGRPIWAELLIFIDQFEELFTLVDERYRKLFVDLLRMAARTERVRAVVTIRADFYHRCLELPELNSLITKDQITLLAPKSLAMSKMISCPVESAGLQLEEGLAQRILDDTGSEPGALALMAFALLELWKKSQGSDGRLTHAAYDSFGGVQGAIGQRAETTFNSLKENNTALELETAFSRVFRKLLVPDKHGVVARRRLRLNQIEDWPVSKSLVDVLTEARLLVKDFGKEDEPMVEVAHEAIFSKWPRLSAWIKRNRNDLQLLGLIDLATTVWINQGKAKDYLWSHELLVHVYQMIERMQPELKPQVEEFIRPENKRLLDEIDDAATTHKRRAKIGERLAEIGDTRTGVGLRADGLPDIAWCEVPAGAIFLDKRVRPIAVDDFLVSKYLVTWIQYRSFLAAEDGYRNPRWWQQLKPDPDGPGDQYHKLDNHPAENVSWYDAVAFCRWLTELLGLNIRLPTECEWHLAATGGDRSNEYPWGEQWDSDRANSLESRLDRTTAVGMYLQGASPFEAMDMAGNVWEWVEDDWHSFEKLNEVSADGSAWIDEPRGASRVIRGGSCRILAQNCRSAIRDDYRPYSRNRLIGIRLARSISHGP